MKYLAITAIVCLILAGASFAGNVTMTEVLTGGDLTLTMPDNFNLSGITIGSYLQQNAEAHTTYTIEDSRGTGAGWNLGLQCSQFQTGATPNRTIVTSAFNVSAFDINITCIYGQAKDVTNGPKCTLGGTHNINSSETKALTAANGYGMGKYTAQMEHELDIYAETYAGTYTATLTATLNNAP